LQNCDSLQHPQFQRQPKASHDYTLKAAVAAAGQKIINVATHRSSAMIKELLSFYLSNKGE